MQIYVLLVLAILIMHPITKLLFRNSKLVYCLLIGIFLYLILACRDISIGKDLQHLYVPYFKMICKLDLNQLIDFCRSVDTEFSFYFIAYLISQFTHNISLYLAIVALPFILITTRYIYKYSKNAVLSFLVFIALNYYCFAFSALRHTVAAAFLVLSYDFIIKKKKLGFVFCVLLATLMHRSAIIFIMAYPICNLKIRLKQILLILMALFGSLLLKDSILSIIFSIISEGHFSQYKDSSTVIGYAFFFINFGIYIFMSYLYGNQKNKYENQVNLNLQFLCTCFAAFVPMFAEMLRISFFFGIFACCGLPNAIDCSRYESNKKIYNFILSTLLIVYFLEFALINNDILPYVSIFS